MTKQDATIKAHTLLDALDRLPDSVDIHSGSFDDCAGAPNDICIYLHSGIDEVENTLEAPAVREIDGYGNYCIHRHVYSDNCDYAQIFWENNKPAG